MRRRRTLVGALLAAALAVTSLTGPASGADNDSPTPSPTASETATNDPTDSSSLDNGASASDEMPAVEENLRETDAAQSEAVESGPEDRAAAVVTDPLIEATMLGTDNATVIASLTESGADVSINRGQQINLQVHAIFSSATEKRVEIALKPGVKYRDGAFNLDPLQGWVQELKTNGQTIPAKQTDDSKKPSKIYDLTIGDGTLSYDFQDTTQEVTFIVPLMMDKGLDGALSVSDAITVKQSYVREGESQVETLVRASTTLKNPRTFAYQRIRTNVTNQLNANGNIPIGIGDPKAYKVTWEATPNDASVALTEEYSIAILAPEKAEYHGLATKQGDRDLKDSDLTTYNAGEHVTLSDGSDYIVPAGKKLYVWERKNLGTTFEFDGSIFDPSWSFPEADFPMGTIATIELIDSRVKLHNPYGDSSYLSYSGARGKVSYEIVEPREDVYVNTTMYGDKNKPDWPLWEGYIADNNVFLGAPGYEHTQERTFGYFTIGNRGTGDSRAKTIIIDYDVNNTGVGGVTAQALPFLSHDYHDAKATKVTDFKVTLWDSNTNTTKEYTFDNPPQRFRVQTLLGTGKHEGIYLKHIEYKVDTIPAKTEWVSYENNGGYGNTGRENLQAPTVNFPYYGVVRNNTVIEKGKWGDDPSLFKTRIRIENTGQEEPTWHHRNQDEWDLNNDGTAEKLKYEGRSKDHVTIGDTFTAFTGKSYIKGHGPTYGWESGTNDPPVRVELGKQVTQDLVYFTPKWDGSAQGIQSYKAAYVVSPYGSPMSFSMRYRSVASKQSWTTGFQGDVYTPAVGPEVYTVPASDSLKAEYPNAVVYKLDFSKLTSEQDKFDTRAFGPSLYWGEAQSQVPYSINDAFWGYTGIPIIRMSYTSDSTKDKPGSVGWWLWYEFDTDTEEELVYGDGMAKDKWDLNGDGSTDDMFGTPRGKIEINAPTDVVVQSAAKMATQPDSRYITYDGQSKTEIGANSTVDYRLVATNPTLSDVNGFTIYWPVPKKDQYWGQALEPNIDGKKHPFEFDMFLSGGVKSQLPAGYTVWYAKNATPTSDALKWDGFTWTEEKDTASWTQEDWDAVNFVRISSPADSAFAAGSNETFLFNMRLRDISDEEYAKKLLNVMAPAYLRDLGSGKGYRYGQPVAMTVLAGIVSGTVWEDLDNDSVMDPDEPKLQGLKLELVDEANNVVDTAISESDGKYTFKGLRAEAEDLAFKSFYVKAYRPAEYTDNGITHNARFAQALTEDKGDMRLTATNPTDAYALSELVTPSQITVEPTDEPGDTPSTESVGEDRAAAPSVTLAFRQDVGIVPARSVQVTKTWAAETNEATKVPVSVGLLAGSATAVDLNGASVAPATLNADGQWTATFTNLPVNNATTNEEIQYTAAENPVPDGFTAAVSGNMAEGLVVTNTPNISVNVTKAWNDADNQDGKRASSVSVKLKADGEDVAGKTITLSGDNNWTGSFTDLPKQKDGRDIAYTIEETDVPAGYTAAVTGDAASGFVVTNTHEVEKTSVDVSKVWEDAENQDGVRPGSVTVKLLADGEDAGKTVVLNEANKWKGTFSDLDKYASGTEVAYTVEETDVPAGYTAAVTGDAKAGFVVTNTHTPAVRAISVTKAWDDANNQDNMRPSSVSVQLFADGEAVTAQPVLLDASNNWTTVFADVPVNKAGKPIAYTVVESDVPEYTSNATQSSPLAVPAGGDVTVTVTNSHTPVVVSVPVSKVWVDNDDAKGLRPTSVTVQLKADGVSVEGKTLDLTAGENWAGSFTDLPKFKAGEVGQEVVYSVEEAEVEHYTASYSGNAADGLTVTNTITGQTSVAVTKAWSGVDADAAPGVVVELLADGVKVSEARLDGNAEGGSWSHTFADLDQYKGGKEIVYTVVEQGVQDGKLSAGGHDYTVGVVKAEGSNSWTVTNTLVNPEVRVPVTKVWDDADNQDGIRPDSVKVKLLATHEGGEDAHDAVDLDSVPVVPLVVTSESDWAGEFTNLPMYDSKGRVLTYSIVENDVEGYEAAIDISDEGITVTNTHEPDVMTIPVSKKWEDADDKDRIRPSSVTVKLIANGVPTGKELTLDAKNAWAGSFDEVAVNDNGKEIEYSIEEVTVEGYTSEVTGNPADGFVVTNTHEPKVVVKKKLPLTGANVVTLGALAMAVLVGGVVILRRREEA
ncbi:Cna B-type domain-containing protein [Arcanobacterium haemolyticum]|nr:Cna B-type domain-containing protein [Arcanobacterium haemolyticum]